MSKEKYNIVETSNYELDAFSGIIFVWMQSCQVIAKTNV